MSRRVFVIFGILSVLCPLVFGQGAIDPALQGSWSVIGAQHGGKPMDGLTGGTMTVTGDRFEIHTASGNLLKGRLQVDLMAKPATAAMLHDSGLRWQAIYEAKGDDFKLNYVDAAGRDKLPTEFRTSSDTEATLVILKRAK
jgi:uncharacterized protein (TIGR03067 family)